MPDIYRPNALPVAEPTVCLRTLESTGIEICACGSCTTRWQRLRRRNCGLAAGGSSNGFTPRTSPLALAVSGSCSRQRRASLRPCHCQHSGCRRCFSCAVGGLERTRHRGWTDPSAWIGECGVRTAAAAFQTSF